MAEIVNLRLARKARDRSRKQDEAQRSRMLFGRTKADRRLSEAQRAKAERELDSRRLVSSDLGQPEPARPDEP